MRRPADFLKGVLLTQKQKAPTAPVYAFPYLDI